MRAETADVAFRLLLALAELWDGLHRAGVDPARKGLHLRKEYLGGYVRVCAGPSAHARITFEWNEAKRHLRVLRCEPWPGFEATLRATVTWVRDQARAKGIAEVVEQALVRACQREDITLQANRSRGSLAQLAPDRA